MLDIRGCVCTKGNVVPFLPFWAEWLARLGKSSSAPLMQSGLKKTCFMASLDRSNDPPYAPLEIGETVLSRPTRSSSPVAAD